MRRGGTVPMTAAELRSSLGKCATFAHSRRPASRLCSESPPCSRRRVGAGSEKRRGRPVPLPHGKLRAALDCGRLLPLCGGRALASAVGHRSSRSRLLLGKPRSRKRRQAAAVHGLRPAQPYPAPSAKAGSLRFGPSFWDPANGSVRFLKVCQNLGVGSVWKRKTCQDLTGGRLGSLKTQWDLTGMALWSLKS